MKGTQILTVKTTGLVDVAIPPLGCLEEQEKHNSLEMITSKFG